MKDIFINNIGCLRYTVGQWSKVIEPMEIGEYLTHEWQILGRAKDCTEEQAASLVERKPLTGIKFRDKEDYDRKYWEDYTGTSFVWYTALESFRSWLKSNNIPDETVLLIKK